MFVFFVKLVIYLSGCHDNSCEYFAAVFATSDVYGPNAAESVAVSAANVPVAKFHDTAAAGFDEWQLVANCAELATVSGSSTSTGSQSSRHSILPSKNTRQF